MKKNLLFSGLTVCLLLTGYDAISQFTPGINSPGFFKSDGEFPINTELAYIAAPYSQSYSSVAFDGTVYLVVWQDSRNEESDIYGARVDISGNLLDPAGFIICKEPGSQTAPAIATNGDFFLVVWRDERIDGSDNDDIYGARITTAGVVMDTSGFPICCAEDDQDYPAVASVGSDFCVTWADFRKGNDKDIYANFVQMDGTVSHVNGFPICTSSSYQSYPDICSDGIRYFIVWGDGQSADDDIFGSFVETNGTVSHPNGTAIAALPNDQNHPAIYYGEEQYFLAWEDDASGSNELIRGSRVNMNGSLLDPNGITISNFPELYCVWPDVCFDGSNFWVAYAKGNYGFNQDFDNLACRITSEGEVLDPSGILIAGTEYREEQPALAFDGQQMLICRQEVRNSSDIYGTFCDLQGNIIPTGGILLSPGFNNQLDGKISFDGTNYMTIWLDTRNDNSFDIYAARVNQQGMVIDQEALPIITGEGDCRYPSISFNGTHYLVVWEHGSDLFGVRVSTDGQVLDADGLVIYQGNWTQTNPSIASDGQNWLVVWEDGRNSTGNNSHYDIYGTLISTDGSIINPQGFPVIAYQTDQKNASVTFDGTNYVVVWEDYRSGFFFEPAIYGARVSPDGTVLDINGLALAVNEDKTLVNPSVAFSAGMLMVCYTEFNAYQDVSVVKFVRFTPQMTILDIDPVTIDPASNRQNSCLVTSFDNRFFVIWADDADFPSNYIAMSVVNTDGNIEERGILGETGESVSAPALTSGPSGKVLGLFSSFTETIGEDIINAKRLYGKQCEKGTGTSEQAEEDHVIIWPNPGQGEFRIANAKFQNKISRIKILDMNGKVMMEKEISREGKEEITIDASYLQAGVYFCRVTSANQLFTQQIVIIK
jgi:hypothetical protein